ncbi:hypothetical protein FRB95_005504 [Tulasnella sp. JGI-2019a]|nr:hypothetical protein FRB95_005504 [Tulasnella sp. JGI-2019a]
MEYLRERWRRWRLRWTWWSAKWRDPRTASAFERLLIAVLNNMENLHTLHIEDDMISPGLVTWSCLPIIGRSRLPSLKSLSLTGDAYAYSHEFASDLFFFIQNHTLLEHLQLPHGYGNLPFLPTDIPYLKSLVATTEDARKIVWGRRITSLELQDMPCHSFEEVWSDLRGSTNALRRVSLVASSEPSLLASNLNAMARQVGVFPRLPGSDIWWSMFPTPT